MFNATEMCIVAELKLQAGGRALVAPLKSCSFMLPPKDEDGLPVPGAELEEVKPRQVKIPTRRASLESCDPFLT